MTETPEAEADFDYLLTSFKSKTRWTWFWLKAARTLPSQNWTAQRRSWQTLVVSNDNNIIAIAADSRWIWPTQMAISDLEAIRDFIIEYAQSFDNFIDHKQNSVVFHLQKDDTPVVCCDSFSPAGLSVTQGQQKDRR